jgi:hypothetical protein
LPRQITIHQVMTVKTLADVRAYLVRNAGGFSALFCFMGAANP